MVVETKELTEKKDNASEINKITQQARLEEKKRIKGEKELKAWSAKIFLSAKNSIRGRRFPSF